MNVAVSSEGHVYVTDDALDRISRFTGDGELVRTWGHHGSGPGELVHPQGMAIGSGDRLWVIDYGNHRGQAFTKDGRHLFIFGEGTIGTKGRAGPAPSGAVVLAVPAAGALAGALAVTGARRRRGRGSSS